MERGENINAPPLQLSATLAKPLANPWRNRILAEVHLRPMSPKQFVDEFGGPGLTTISRYFRELREWNFLEVAEELSGGGRRGEVEKVHRAIQRVHFDTPTWATLPRYLRSECSASIMQGLIKRITQAIEAGTFDAEKDRHLSWKAVYLDRTAWSEFAQELDEILLWIGDLEAESANRNLSKKETSISMTVGLLAFRSPAESLALPADATVTESDARGPYFIMSPRTAKALASPWRNRILAELHMRPMSPKQFVEEIGGPDLTTTARYFRQLRKAGFLEVTEELRGGARRGTVEKVHRAVRRAHFSTPTWELLPKKLRTECSTSILDGLILRINEAVAADTFDEETDRHLSWKALSLDRQGWTECVTRLDKALASVGQLEKESAERLSGTDGEKIPATVALLAFRSPDSAL